MLKFYLAVVACAFAVVAAEEAAGEEKFSKFQFLGNEYELTTGDDEDYASALKAFGIEEATVTKHKAAKPIVSLTFEDGKYHFKTEGGEVDDTDTFTLGAQEDDTEFGVAVKATFHAEDEDTLVETLELNGKELKLKWDFAEQELKCTVTIDDVTAERVYTLVAHS